ncbi:two-partner secretion domain-containing protein [Gilvimarinus sp. F26214L]|uniref:two-partner secretion domain-containing protein n=1 Tax=Gilvimarinus sp. DZF01 TaxID=3461371 RepID=UPI004045D80D
MRHSSSSSKSTSTCLTKKLPLPSRRQLCLAVAAASHLLVAGRGYAGPTGGQVVGGTGSIHDSGSSTIIAQQSERLAIDWASFNVGADEQVQFVQPNSSSIALNRVLSHSGSEIHGRIDANGHVFLVNPNGVFFGEGARINVGGMLASGLDVDPADFMNGDYAFSAVEGSEGRVVNEGIIHAATGGSIGLLGRQIRNEGIISANLGAVNLAAGNEAVVTFEPNGLIGVRITEAVLQEDLGVDAAIINNGTISASGGRILLSASTSEDIFSQAVNSGGLSDDRSVVVHEDGSFTLGGGADLVNTGTISASSDHRAGDVVLLAENVTSSGTIAADSAHDEAGSIEIHAADTALLTEQSLTSARSEAGATGGHIKLLGDRVGLFDDAKVDVSGALGGGEVLLGGDFQGRNHQVRNASRIFVDEGAAVYADALTNGDGGRIIVWADEITRFRGTVYGRAALDGEGGFAEVSGKTHLEFAGYSYLNGAGSGGFGTLLLDPENITVENTEPSESSDFGFDDYVGDGISIDPSTIKTALESSELVLQATDSISVLEKINASDQSNTLRMEAGNRISIEANIDVGSGNLEFVTGRNGCGSNPSACAATDSLGRSFTLASEKELVTTGGISIFSADDVDIKGSIGSGSDRPNEVTIRAGNNIDIGIDGEIDANGTVTLSAGDSSDEVTESINPNGTTYASLNISGNLSTRGGDVVLNALYDPGLAATDPAGVSRGAVVLGGAIDTGGGDLLVGEWSATGELLESVGSVTVNGSSGLDNVSDIRIGAVEKVDIDADLMTDGGNVEIHSEGNLTTRNIDTSSDGGDGGAITLAADEIALVGHILSQGGSNEGQGGAVNINGNLTLHSDTEIRTGADGSDKRADITITGSVNGFSGSEELTLSGNNIQLEGHLGAGSGLGSVELSSQNAITIGDGEDDYYNITASELNVGAGGAFESGDLRASLEVDIAAETIHTGAINTTGAHEANGGNVTLAGRTIRTETITANGGTVPAPDPETDPTPHTAAGSIQITATASGGEAASITIAGDLIAKDSNGTTKTPQLNIIDNNVGLENSVTFSGPAFVSQNVKVNGEGNTTLNISEPASDWRVDGSGSGTVKALGAASGVIEFGQVHTLVGSAGDDTFTLATGDQSGMTIRGGGEATGGDKLVGFDQETVWTLTDPGNGSLDSGLTFEGIESLRGGDQKDTFRISPSQLGLIDIDGGDRAGNSENTLDFSGTGGEIEVELGSAAWDRINNIQVVQGNGSSSTLRAGNDGNTWTINGVNSGEVSGYRFTDWAHLVGGSGDDEFVIGSAGRIESIDGGTDGVNKLTGRNDDNIWTISATVNSLATDVNSSAPYVESFSNIQQLQGGGAKDTFTIQTAFAGTILGGAGDDEFYLQGDGSVTSLDGEDGSDLLIARDEHNLWQLTSAGNQLGIKVSADDTTVYVDSFANVETLQGGSAVDEFQIDANFGGTIRGGDGADLFVFGSSGVVDTIDGEAGSDTLQGRDEESYWTVAGLNAGGGPNGAIAGGGYIAYLNSFTDVEHLQGGRANDWFAVQGTGSVAGHIDGGGGMDVLDLAAANGAYHVELGTELDLTGVTGTGLHATGMWGVEGNGHEGSTLRVAAGSNHWLIEGLDRGRVNGVLFTNFANATGGSGEDHFLFDGATAGLSGLLDGGGGENSLTGRAENTDWYLDGELSGHLVRAGDSPGDAYAQFSNVQTLAGRGLEDSLVGRNQDNHWIITDMGTGSVGADTASPTDTVAFSGMANLQGNAGADIFEFDGGRILGNLRGGAGDDLVSMSSDSVGGDVFGEDGNDQFDVEVLDGASGQLSIDGGADKDTVNITGGSAAHQVEHALATAGGGALRYTDGGAVFTLGYSALNTVNDDFVADSLRVGGTTATDDLVLGDNLYRLNDFTTVTFTGKNNLIAAFGNDDKVALEGRIEVDGTVEITNGTVTAGTSGLIVADRLLLDGVGTVGDAGARLRSNVSDLAVVNGRGDIFLQEQNGLRIVNFDSASNFDVQLMNGNLSANTALVSTQSFSAHALNGDLLLTEQNALSGSLELDASGAIELVNTDTTTFSGLRAQKLAVTSSGTIKGSGAIEVSGLSTFETESSVLLENTGNDFGSLDITANGQVSVVDKNTLTISGITSEAGVSVSSRDNLIVDGVVSATNGLNLESSNGDVTQNADLDGGDIMVSAMGDITMAGDARSRASGEIRYDADSMGLGSLEAQTVELNASGAIGDRNGDGLNVLAERLNIVAESGVGANDALETGVGFLSLSNNRGDARIINDRELTVTGLRSNGNIALVNTFGNVILDNTDGALYSRSATDARQAGGTIDANYEVGGLLIDVANGNILAAGPPNGDDPIIAARNASLVTPRGGIGEPYMPLVVHVKDNLVLVSALPSWIQFAFEQEPANVDDSQSISGDVIDLITSGNEQLVEIEGLEDVDPAVFTNVRNYSYDDTSIRLPPDQRYDDDDY